MDRLAEGKRVFDVEIEALKRTRDMLGDTFVEILGLITNCKGKIVITGMGKSGHIAAKIAATLASLGTPSFYLHPAEAMHGDLGMVSENDVVIAISHSGESEEVIKIIPNIKLIGAKVVGVTGNSQSALAQTADIVQVLPEFEEACHLGLAPTSSTTASLCYGDALAVVASIIYGFTDTDFGRFHPAGTLGKRIILKVGDLMAKGMDNPQIRGENLLTDAITEMSEKGLGVVSVVDEDGYLAGIITDGDLRRIIERRVDIYAEKVSHVMTRSPKRITEEKMAVDALRYIHEKRINNLPVVDKNGKLIGMITWQMIIRAGIVL